MNEQLLVVIDEKGVRFTPDGKVAVIDAINALTDHMPAEKIWEEFRRENPDIACFEYRFSEDKTLCVVDRPTMERVEDWLFAFTVERISKRNRRRRRLDEYIHTSS